MARLIRMAIVACGMLTVVAAGTSAETTRLCEMSVDYNPSPKQSTEIAGVWEGAIGVVTGEICAGLAVVGLNVNKPDDVSIYVRYVWNSAKGHGVYNQNILGNIAWKIIPLGNNRYEMVGTKKDLKIEMEMTRSGHLEGKYTLNGSSVGIRLDKLR